MTPAFNRHNSTGTNSTRYDRQRRHSASSHAAASPASTAITAPDADLFTSLIQCLDENGADDVVAITIYRRRPASNQEARSRSTFSATGVCRHCDAGRGYERNMCKHLSDCTPANRHLDQLEWRDTHQKMAPGRPRSQTDGRPNRPILPQPQPPSLVIPDMSTRINVGPRFPSNQLSPQDALNIDTFRSSFHRTPTGIFHSAPSSQLGDTSDYMQTTDSTLSEAPITVGNQDYTNNIDIMSDANFVAGEETFEHLMQPQQALSASILDDGAMDTSVAQSFSSSDPFAVMESFEWERDQWWVPNNQFNGVL
ncbi:hypothetical protein KVT40_007127 [Elsinoe batatas]|uniref:Uncharacterized protein n=1 Tax=Elsinoe batatas TaxID=2601811 RepID=A0A8K0KWH9_9PEZI|nr:hypothetical protein KVT40_007127 [Elsinoe batatas]